MAADVERHPSRVGAPMLLEDIRAAHDRIKAHIYRTPVLTSSSLDAATGARLFFKCENLQRAGVFKVRGAFNAVFSLTDAQGACGVVTSSSGNQAAALSLAAKTRGISAYVAMPRSAAASKVAAVRRYGGQITWVDTQREVPTAEEYEVTVARIQEETGAESIHPYNDSRTIAGQGTCALELLEQVQDLDIVLAPVGGGGLLSGTAVTVRGLRPTCRVFGCEPEAADDAQQSLRAGQILPQVNPRTIADGLRTSLGDLTWPLIHRHVDDIVTVSEQAIVRAMRLSWETLKLVIEPSSAVPMAAMLEGRLSAVNKRVGIIVSGGNVDLDKLPWVRDTRP